MLLVFIPTWIYYEAAPVGAAALLYLLPLYSAVLVLRRRDSARRAGPPARAAPRPRLAARGLLRSAARLRASVEALALARQAEKACIWGLLASSQQSEPAAALMTAAAAQVHALARVDHAGPARAEHLRGRLVRRAEHPRERHRAA